jgi:prolyl-tRNA synthetase
MKYSRMFIPTVKEVPSDAETISHKLMIRAGLCRKVASGTYTYLPLGWRCLLKIIAIVREEMNRAGAQEIMVPSLQPLELWEKTGRSVDYGPTMFRLEDRHGKTSVLSPTAEEVVTFLAAGEINSYKQMPVNLYQISAKFRDEFRPRFGPIRSREFIMKDAYSFDADEAGLNESYQAMYDAYCRIFQRCGVAYVIVQAESGEMGGSGSHQFTIPCESGEDTIVYTEDGSYAANLERATVDPVPKDKERDVPAPQEVHTPNIGTIEAVCEFLKTRPKEMIKTLIYTSPPLTAELAKSIDREKAKHAGGSVTVGEPVVYCHVAVLVRGDHEVNSEKLRIVLGDTAELAEPGEIQFVTGANVGFAGPAGLADSVDRMVIDHSVAAMASGVAGANKTDYHVRNVVPGRDFPLEGDNIVVADIRYAEEGDTYNGKPLLFKKGIEVGQVFKLGTKYSRKLGAKFLDEKVARAADGLYQQLLDKGIDVLLDDRVLRGGAKFKDADLIGIPVRVTVGKKSLAEGAVEIKLRRESQSRSVRVELAAEEVIRLIGSLKEELNV